jgi:glycerol-3-phosphate dehydrogenase
MATPADFDLAVIGGGINGAGIARDAALRGLSVVLFEQGDFCNGTTAASSRLIHGGLRYLEYGEIPLVYESLHERRNLRHIAPHLVQPLRITIPVFAGARRGTWLIRAGMLAYDILSWNKKMPGHEMLSRPELLRLAPGIRQDGLRAGASYFDAQVTFAERLVVENVIAAALAGAELRNRHRIVGIDIERQRVQTLHWENTLTGAGGVCTAQVVVNAAGPWVDQVLAVTNADVDPLIGGTKGSHIVVSPFAGAPADAFYVEAAADGRPLFILPWNNLYLIGTTDIRYDESLDEVRASRAEVDYLLAETNRVFPQAGLQTADIHYAYAGVRPLPRRKKGPESAITRKHIILVNRDVAQNLVSIIGGKLTTYRNLAEQTVDRVAKLLQRRLPRCRTADTLLPGGDDTSAARAALSNVPALSTAGTERLLGIYGSRVTQLLALQAQNTAFADTIDTDHRVLASEVVFAIRNEFALTLTDLVYRRLMVGFAPDQGRGMYDRIASIAAQELNWDAARRADELRRLEDYSNSLRVN